MDPFTIVSFFQSWGPVLGPALGIIVFFLWKDWRREVRLLDRVETLEKEHKDVLLPLVAKCVEVVAENTITHQRLERVISRCTAVAKNEQKDILSRLIEDSHDDAA